MSSTSSRSVYVVTYNLLTPPFAKKSDYPRNSSADLDSAMRFNLICERLSNEMEQYAILCLQEVSQEVCGRLLQLFSEKNYSFIYRLYSGERSDYMGVGIAYPRKKYRLQDCVIQRIQDNVGVNQFVIQRKVPDSYARESFSAWLVRILSGGYFKLSPSSWFVENESLQKQRVTIPVSNRANAMIILHFAFIGAENAIQPQFAVATCHLPCAWRQPDAMILFAALVLKHLGLHVWRNNFPTILAGDFNIKPHDNAYKVLTKNPDEWPLPKDAVIRDLVVAIRDDFDKDTDATFASVYRSVMGREPEFTTHVYTALRGGSGSDFKDTIDYIFTRNCRQDWVRHVLSGATTDSTLLPSAACREPSDHLMLAANIGI